MKLAGKRIVELLRTKHARPCPLEQVGPAIRSLILDDREIHAVVEEHLVRPFYPDTPLETLVQQIAFPGAALLGQNRALFEHVIAPRMRFERQALRAAPLPPAEKAVVEGGIALVERMEALPDAKGALVESHPREANLMADDLDAIRAALPPGAGYFHDYFGCLRSALLCRRPARAPWLEVDEAWALIPPTERLLPVMQTGFRLMLRKQGLEAVRHTMAQWDARLEAIDIALYTTVLHSGALHEVKAHGTKIALDEGMLEHRARRAAERVRARASRATQEWALPALTGKTYLRYTAGRALGRLVAPGQEEAIEELKASLLGLQAIGEETAAAAVALARILELSEAGRYSYRVEAAGLYRALKPAMEEDGLHIDPHVEPLFELSSMVLKGCLARDRQALEALRMQYADPGPGLNIP
jgi:hypothetical protein